MLRATSRVGFSLIEMVVSIAILAVLGGAIVPSLSGYLTQKKAVATAITLDSLSIGVRRFRTSVTRYPSRLSLLTTPPVAANDNSLTTCGMAATTTNRRFTAANVTAWVSAGPFFTEDIPTTGVRLPIGTAADNMVRVPATITGINTAGVLEVSIPSVEYSDAIALNGYVDGSADINAVNRSNATGAIRWASAPSAAETVTLIYRIPVGKVC